MRRALQLAAGAVIIAVALIEMTCAGFLPGGCP